MRLVYLILISCVFFSESWGEIVGKEGRSIIRRDLYPGKEAWEIKPHMEWVKILLLSSPEYRKSRLSDLYEKIDLGKDKVKSDPHTGNPFGLHILKYYVIGSKDDQTWKIADSLGREYMNFTLFYSSDRVYSRQVAMENFIKMEKCMPHIHSGLFRYVEKGNEIVMLVAKDEPRRRIYLMEKRGYCLWMDSYSPLKLTYEETCQVAEAILDNLAGERKLNFFPKRSRIIEERNRLPYKEQEKYIHDLSNFSKSMSSLSQDVLQGCGGQMIKALCLESLLEKSEEEVIPNISRGIGTIKWIKTHLNIPFMPEFGSNETHVDGLTGTFLIKKDKKAYPVEYVIAHLPSRNRAIKAIFSMQAWRAVDTVMEKDDISKIVEMTQVYPGLVGDYDLCLKPILNSFGTPIAGFEHTWISFIRGNTAVMLKSMDMKVSVLPLAKILDEALKKNIELYEKPEIVQ